MEQKNKNQTKMPIQKEIFSQKESKEEMLTFRDENFDETSEIELDELTLDISKKQLNNIVARSNSSHKMPITINPTAEIRALIEIYRIQNNIADKSPTYSNNKVLHEILTKTASKWIKEYHKYKNLDLKR